MSETITIHSVTQVHQALGLPKPKHPLVTVVHSKDIQNKADLSGVRVALNLYQVTLKKGHQGTLKYGQNSYDFEEGTLVFMAPGQVVEYEMEEESDPQGWSLCFHPDLIRKSDLAERMDAYSFFNYASNEALHLSDEELVTIEELLEKIVREYSQNQDRYSRHLTIANIQLLLDYCVRFYNRQFYMRTPLNTDVISKFERLLKAYYKSQKPAEMGMPTVNYCAGELNMSANYLGDLLKKETGKSAREHIHLFVIEKAKTNLLNSTASVSEVGYALGFQYPQHFSNLFKSKTGMSPREYRRLN